MIFSLFYDVILLFVECSTQTFELKTNQDAETQVEEEYFPEKPAPSDPVYLNNNSKEYTVSDNSDHFHWEKTKFPAPPDANMLPNKKVTLNDSNQLLGPQSFSMIKPPQMQQSPVDIDLLAQNIVKNLTSSGVLAEMAQNICKSDQFDTDSNSGQSWSGVSTADSTVELNSALSDSDVNVKATQSIKRTHRNESPLARKDLHSATQSPVTDPSMAALRKSSSSSLDNVSSQSSCTRDVSLGLDHILGSRTASSHASLPADFETPDCVVEKEWESNDDHMTSVDSNMTSVDDHMTPVSHHVTGVNDYVTPAEDSDLRHDGAAGEPYFDRTATPDNTSDIRSSTPSGDEYQLPKREFPRVKKEEKVKKTRKNTKTVPLGTFQQEPGDVPQMTQHREVNTGHTGGVGMGGFGSKILCTACGSHRHRVYTCPDRFDTPLIQ